MADILDIYLKIISNLNLDDTYKNILQDNYNTRVKILIILSNNLFNGQKYSYVSNVSGELVEKNAPVYKLVTSDTWNIAIKLNKKQYNRLKNKKSIGVIFDKNNLETNAKIKIVSKGGDKFAILTLSDYLINFIDDRYINIQLAFNTATGLKIPNSSIVAKDFYVVPKKCFSKGGNSDDLGLLVKEYKRNGDANNKRVGYIVGFLVSTAIVSNCTNEYVNK